MGYLYPIEVLVGYRCVSSSLQTALAVGDVEDVKELAKESRIKLQVGIIITVLQVFYEWKGRFSDNNFKLKTFADVSIEYTSCHEGA